MWWRMTASHSWLLGSSRRLWRPRASGRRLGAISSAIPGRVRGRLRGVIPDKVRVLSSKDLENWTPMTVDYHAEATATILAAAGDDHLWMATDTGMILKLVR